MELKDGEDKLIRSSRIETTSLYINSIFGAQGWRGQVDKELKDRDDMFIYKLHIWSSRIKRTS